MSNGFERLDRFILIDDLESIRWFVSTSSRKATPGTECFTQVRMKTSERQFVAKASKPVD